MGKTRVVAKIGWAIALCILPAGVCAHPVSVSRVLVYVEPEQLNAEVQVFLEDLFLFHQLKTDSRDYLSTDEIGKGVRLHREFVRQRFKILDVNGRVIKPKRVELIGWQAPEEGVPIAELMSHQLTFALRFEPFSKSPEFLTFLQKFSDEEAILPSEMTLRVQQEGQPEAEAVSLRPHKPHIMRLRWDGPQLDESHADDSKKNGGSARREAWLAKAKEETLGISDYSSVYSFLYIEPRQVRHEILVPLRTLAQALELEHADSSFLTHQEQTNAIPRIAKYFGDGVPIAINGVEIQPQLETCQFFGLELKDLAQASDEEDIATATGRVGIIFSYTPPKRVQTVAMTWNQFSDSWWSVPVAVIAGDQTEKKVLSRIGKRNRLEWTLEAPAQTTFSAISVAPRQRRFSWSAGAVWLAIALASVTAPLLCWRGSRRRKALTGLTVLSAVVLWSSLFRPVVLGRVWPEVLPSSVETKQIFLPLHRNIYSSMEYVSDEEIYDALEQSVAGETLTEIYRQLHRNLTMKDQGGAVARVEDVQVKRSELEQKSRHPQTFQHLCQWEVTGTVEHWGHLHRRRQAHEALFTVRAVDGYWKIVHWDLLDERLLDTSVTVRQ